MRQTRRLLSCILLLAGRVALPGAAQTQPSPKVPSINGAVGPCSLELSVTTADGKPVYSATVKVHIPYGFGGFHKLDLEAGTNEDGKVSFVGLPSRVRRPPLEFQASKAELTGTAEYNPEAECEAKHVIVLGTPKPSPGD